MPFHPSWGLICFYLILMGAGALLLFLPVAAAGPDRPSFLDALFTATSAATGTGLVVVDTASFWSGTGHWVLLALVQIGGLGTLIGSTIFLLLIARRVGPEDRELVQDSMGVGSARGMVLLIVGITVFSLAAELLGAFLIASRLRLSMPAGDAWWQGIFHSASAFNNAGLEIMDLGRRLPEARIQLVLTGLSVLGAIGFLVVLDMLRRLLGRSLSLDTRLVLVGSVLLLAGGAALVLLTEGGNPDSLGAQPFWQKVLSAVFYSASARTAGLSSVGFSAFAHSTFLLLIALMFIGGGAGSTAGGIKVNTFALLAAVTWSFVRGQPRVSVLGKAVHEEQVYRALAVAFLSLVLVFGVTLALSITEGAGLLEQLFEAVSAFSTTGLSMGLTSTLTSLGKLVLVFTMFAGRVGPLALAFALARRSSSRHSYTQEAVNLG
ncbi:MAG: hypothetical protein HYY01_14890 [Chloroflexi bacterium]|nr:hypothetical protein [Chloroflexota bacterium]